MNTVNKTAIISFFVSSLWLYQFMDCCVNLLDIIIFFGGYVGLLILPPYLVWIYERQQKFREEKIANSN